MNIKSAHRWVVTISILLAELKWKLLVYFKLQNRVKSFLTELFFTEQKQSLRVRQARADI